MKFENKYKGLFLDVDLTIISQALNYIDLFLSYKKVILK